MALRFVDSFDHYTAGSILEKWTNGSASTFVTGRWGTTALRLESGGSSRTLSRSFIGGHATWIFGSAFNIESIPGGSSLVVLQLMEGVTNHVDLRVTTAGRLQVTRNGTQLGLGPTTISPDVWYFIELKVVINDTTGVAHLRINGATELNLTNQDTQNGASGVIDTVLLRGGGPPGTQWDDIYMCDGSGSAPTNDLLGDCRVECLLPNGNGNSSQFDGSDGNQIDNYLLVDDPTDDGDTTYVQSPDTGDKDTYTYGDLVMTSGTVYGVQPVPSLRKSEAGSRRAASVARLSATEEDSADKIILDGYRFLPDIRETKPGGGAWTISDVNSAEFGIKVTG